MEDLVNNPTIEASVQVIASLPADYPDTPAMQRVAQYHDEKHLEASQYDSALIQTIKGKDIAEVLFTVPKQGSGEPLYLARFFVYPALFAEHTLPEEKQGMRSLGKYLMCTTLRMILASYGPVSRVAVHAGGGGYITSEMSDDDALEWYEQHPGLLRMRERIFNHSLEYFESEGIQPPIRTFRDFLISSIQRDMGTLNLCNYYNRAFGFEAVDPAVLDGNDEFEGGIDMAVSTETILAKCHQ